MSAAQQELDDARAAMLAAELRVLMGQLKRRLRESTDAGGLSWTQIAILGRLEKTGKATVTSLARDEGMRPQSMGSIIAALEEAGFVHGTPDPEDGRQTHLSLTESGLTWIRANRATRLDWLTRAIEARLSGSQQDQLAAALTLLKLVVEP